MLDLDLTILLAGVVAGAAPIVLAALGETITEKAGLINLSLDGSILLSAMAAFAIAFETNNVLAGFVGGALVGALMALVVAVFSIYLGQNQVAVGFVLTLMGRDLAYFIGNQPLLTHTGPPGNAAFRAAAGSDSISGRPLFSAQSAGLPQPSDDLCLLVVYLPYAIRS
jgi:simple sugar transport system permease protein